MNIFSFVESGEFCSFGVGKFGIWMKSKEKNVWIRMFFFRLEFYCRISDQRFTNLDFDFCFSLAIFSSDSLHKTKKSIFILFFVSQIGYFISTRHQRLATVSTTRINWCTRAWTKFVFRLILKTFNPFVSRQRKFALRLRQFQKLYSYRNV